MQYSLYVLLSTLELASMFVLMLVLFRFDLKSYILQIIFTSVVVSQLTYLVRYHSTYDKWIPLISILFILLFVHLVFKVQWFYTLIMAISGYIAYGFIQLLVILIGTAVFSIKFVPQELSGYMGQLVSSILSLLIGYLCAKKRMGFTFVPYGEVKVKYVKENIYLMLVSIIGIIVAAVSFYLYLLRGMSYLFSLSVITLFVALLYFSIIKELKDD